MSSPGMSVRAEGLRGAGHYVIIVIDKPDRIGLRPLDRGKNEIGARVPRLPHGVIPALQFERREFAAEVFEMWRRYSRLMVRN